MSKLKIAVSKDDHIQGDENAPVELVEYGDYECPYCGEAYFALKEMKRKMGKNLKFVFRNFPLKQRHRYAENAALAAEAAAAQGKFWEMHEKLFENQTKLAEDDLINYANQIGLDINQFEKDVKEKTYLSKVENDFEGGIRSGVNSTPSFYVNGEKQEKLNDTMLMEYVNVEHS
jgi:protein-disulfide isomerase